MGFACCHDDAAWTRFIGVLGPVETPPAAATVRGRIERRAEIDEVIGAWTAGKTAWEVTHALQSARIAAYP
jgi:crotonobetainyl-CoA:carnitine CoA-transferase CaiB-like acyl-CoA transferase